MKLYTKAAVSGLLWLAFSGAVFGDTLYITSVSENVDDGGQFTAYLGSDPGQQLLIYCVDFQNYEASGLSVNISIPNIGDPTSVADTRYGDTPTADFSFFNNGPGAISAVERYVLAAWLTTQYDFTSGVTSSDDQIQNAIWTLLDTDGTSGFPYADAQGTANWITSAVSWRNAQSPATLSSFESEIRVYTSTTVTSTTTGSQEMIEVNSTPEPATLAMLGAGLLALGLLRKSVKA